MISGGSGSSKADRPLTVRLFPPSTFGTGHVSAGERSYSRRSGASPPSCSLLWRSSAPETHPRTKCARTLLPRRLVTAWKNVSAKEANAAKSLPMRGAKQQVVARRSNSEGLIAPPTTGPLDRISLFAGNELEPRSYRDSHRRLKLF